MYKMSNAFSKLQPICKTPEHKLRSNPPLEFFQTLHMVLLIVFLCIKVGSEFKAATVPIKLYLMVFTASVLLSQLICQTDKVRKWVSYRQESKWDDTNRLSI